MFTLVINEGNKEVILDEIPSANIPIKDDILVVNSTPYLVKCIKRIYNFYSKDDAGEQAFVYVRKM